MKKIMEAVKSTFVPSATQNVDNASSALDTTADNAVSPGSGGLFTKTGEQHSNSTLAKGFAFEHAHEATFNAQAALLGKPYEALRVPPGGIEQLNAERGWNIKTERLGEPDLLIVDTQTGELLQTIQAKCGTEAYIKSNISDAKYNETTDAFLINSDHEHIVGHYRNVSTSLNYDGVSSLPISRDLSQAIAENPELAAALAKTVGDAGEVAGSAAVGAGIGAIFSSLLESIKLLAKIHKGEEIEGIQLRNSLKNIFEALKSGATRGFLIKVIQNIIESDPGAILPVAIANICLEVLPLMQKYLKGEITFEELVNRCGTRSLSIGCIVTVCMAYPKVAFVMMGISTCKTVWNEFGIDEVIESRAGSNSHLKKALATKEAIEESYRNTENAVSGTSANITKKIATQSRESIKEASEKTAKLKDRIFGDKGSKSSEEASSESEPKNSTELAPTI